MAKKSKVESFPSMMAMKKHEMSETKKVTASEKKSGAKDKVSKKSKIKVSK